MESLSDTFRDRVESFLERSDITATRLGTLAVNDPSFVLELRRGRSPSIALADKVLDFIRKYEAARPNDGAASAEAAAT